MSEDRAALRRTFVEMVRDEYPNAGDGIISLFDAAMAATIAPTDDARAVLDRASDWILSMGLPADSETWRPEYEALLADIDRVLGHDAR